MADEEKLRKQAQKALAKGDHGAALKAYQQLLQLRPKDTKLWVNVADLCGRLGQVDTAVKIYSKAAEQYSVDCQLPRAVRIIEQVLKLKPGDAKAAKQLEILKSRMAVEAAARRQDDTVHRWHVQRAQQQDRDDHQSKTAAQASPAPAADNWLSQATQDMPVVGFSEPAAESAPEPESSTGNAFGQWLGVNPEPAVGSDPDLLETTQSLGMSITGIAIQATPRDVQVRDALARINTTGFLAQLDSGIVDTIADEGFPAFFAGGETILSEGEDGTSLYLLVSGRARVLKMDPDGTVFELMEVPVGEVFGEDAWLTGNPRAASVFCEEDVEALEIPATTLDNLEGHAPRIRKILQARLRQRMFDTVVRVNPVLRRLDRGLSTGLLAESRTTAVDPGTVLLQASATEPVTVVLSGVVEGAMDIDGRRRVVCRNSEGFSPGMVEAMTGQAGGITWKAVTRVHIARLDTQQLRGLVKRSADVRDGVQAELDRFRQAISAALAQQE